MKTAKIYIIYNSINDKIYVGFTTNKYISTRLSRHKYNSRLKNKRYNSKLYNAMQKYGEENFYIKTIFESSFINFTFKVMESYFIDFYNSYNYGYNTSLGGEGRLGARHSKEEKERMRLRMKNYRHTEESKLKISVANKNKSHGKPKSYLIIKDSKLFKITNLNTFTKNNAIDRNTLRKYSKKNKLYKNTIIVAVVN